MDFILSKYKWYRKICGGEWINYYPRMFPYMNLWCRASKQLFSHEIEISREVY